MRDTDSHYGGNAVGRVLRRAALLIFLFAGVIWSSQLINASNLGETVFGPETFYRSTGKPFYETRHFPVGNPSAPYLLIVKNGNDDGSNRISSAVVKLNGDKVVVPRDLNQHVVGLKIPVWLKKNSTLKVKLKSKPGSFLTICIRRKDEGHHDDNYHDDDVFDCDGDANSLPVANAGPDQTIAIGNIVTLDASASTDLDGDPLTYAWTLQTTPSGSTAILNDPTAIMPELFVDLPGSYVGELVVNDGTSNSAPDTVTIDTLNSLPVADAGPDQTVFVADLVQLDGSNSSDADNDPLAYSWSILTRPPGSTAALGNPNLDRPSFTPDVAGSYVVELIVNDGLADSAPVTVTITTQNTPPVANAGIDQDVQAGDTVMLDGSNSSDVNGDPLTFSWSFTSVPTNSAVTLDDSMLESPSFVSDLPGMYVAQLIVNDGAEDSVPPDTAVITATATNQGPTAVAGADATNVAVGAQVNLTSSDSSDPENDPLNYNWSLLVPPGSSASLSSSTSSAPSFIPDVAGSYVATLIVDDGSLPSMPDSVNVTAGALNNPPDLIAVGNRSISLGQNYSTRLFAVDPDVGDVLTFSLTVAPAGMSVNPSTGDLQWVPGAGQLGTSNVTAMVADNGGLTDIESFAVTVGQPFVQPPANAPPVLAPLSNRALLFTASLNTQAMATDPDGNPITYSLLLSPAGMSINPGTGVIQWSPAAGDVGLHDVTVQAADNGGLVDVESFIVTVNETNRPPIALDEVYEARIGEITTEGPPGTLGNDTDPDNDPLTAALVSTTSNGVLDFRNDGSFDYTPGLPELIGPVELELQCELATATGDYQTNGTVTVGDVDNDGVQEIVGTTFLSSNLKPELWVMNAEDCSVELAGSPAVVTEGGFTDGPHLGLLDIDGDGDLEIIGPRMRLPDSEGGLPDGQHLMAVHHDGTVAWGSQDIPDLPALNALSSVGGFRYSGPTFADIDANGSIEIIMQWRIASGIFTRNGVTAFNAADGTILWSYLGEVTRGLRIYKPPVVADIDRDGTMEILFNNEVIDHTGSQEFVFPVENFLGGADPVTSHLSVAVANFDADPEAEIVARDQQNNYLFNHDGSLVWQIPAANTSESQITVADFDGDGEVEFAYNTSFGNASSTGFMVVYETDGSILWSHESEASLQIISTIRARGPNATAFDANDDGAMDIVIHYDFGQVPESGVYIFDGRNGALLEFVEIWAAGNAGDIQRYVTITDVDDDGEAEIISSFNGGGISQTRIWQGTSANPLPAAPAMRDQWVFNAAHLDDRRQEIITDPTPHWLQPRLNGYNVISTPDRIYTTLLCDTFPSVNVQHNGTIAVGDVDNDGDIELVGTDLLSDPLFNEVWLLNADCSRQTMDYAQHHIDAGGFSEGSDLGLLDIDGDGDLEIIGTRSVDFDNPFIGGQNLMAIHHDGSLAWPGDGASEDLGAVITGTFAQMGPTFADIDANGSVEIIMAWRTNSSVAGRTQTGITVFNSADGKILWEYFGELQGGDADYKPPLVADLDLDGTMEIIYHTNVVDHLGNLEFILPIQLAPGNVPTFLTTAVANFDDDPFAEIIGIDKVNHYLYNHDGTVIFQNPVNNNAQSQISVADFDGDNEVEYAWYNGLGSTLTVGFFEVYDTDGTLLWSHRGLREFGEENTRFKGVNGTAFDANNDGAFDLVVHLNVFAGTQDDGVYVFDGRDGSVLEFMQIDSQSNEQRFTTIADIDNDGEAEIISSHTSGLTNAMRIWEGVESHPLPLAPAQRNQWIFSEAMVDVDGNIITNPVPAWLQPGLNGYNMIKRPPDPLAGTTDSFTYVANDGVVNSNTATVTFDVQPAGQPPVFLTEPDTLTTVGFPYEYPPRVVDPDPGDSVSFTLAAAPAGMTMSSAGRLNWAPDAEGEFAVSIIASDTIGFVTPQSFTLVVGQPVIVPDVLGQPQSTAETTLTNANLVIDSVQTSTHPTVVAGSVIGLTPISGSVAEFGGEVILMISTGPAPEDVDDDNDGFTENQGDCSDGDDAIFPGATDAAGDGIDQDCDGIDGNLTLASINVTPSASTVLTNKTVSLTATGIFVDGTSQNLTGVVGWTNGPSFSSAAAGSFTVTATRGGINGNAAIDVVGQVAGDLVPPVVEITAPADNSTVTEPVEVTGTASDANFLKYELAYAVAGENSFTTIASSTSPVSNGVLGQFDPTMLVNDLYTIRLTVFDKGGNQMIAETTVQADGNLKVGNFTVSFTDLQIPMAGIPITVTRTYDSRDKRAGDFGFGWRLEIDTLRLRTNDILGSGWRVDKSGLTFVLSPTNEHTVSLTLADGRVEVFDLVVSPQASPLLAFPPSRITGSYQPRAGTLGRLESLDNNILTIFSPQPGEVELADDTSSTTYNPDRFKYTQADGTEIVISKSDGVQSVREPNGNTLTIAPNGITHSSGQSIAFIRDDLGRIASIVDPNGIAQSYIYDGNGDLRKHTDRENVSTSFRYDSFHKLIEIIDPLGNRAIRNEYDNDGRLTASTNNTGDRIEFSHDLVGRQEEITDLRGGLTVYVYDDRGNVLSQTDSDGGVRTFTYDAADNKLSETDPLGKITAQTYDSQNNLLTQTDPLGNVVQHTYNALGKRLTTTDAQGKLTTFTYSSAGENLLTQTDAEGNVTAFTYDAKGNIGSITDPSGAVTLRSYDNFGNQISETDAVGNVSTFAYDSNGNRIQELRTRSTSTVPEVVETRFSYDANDLQTEMIRPDGAVVSVEYDMAGRKSAVIDQNGNRTSFEYDGAGNAIREISPGGFDTTRTYDGNGNVSTLTDRNGNTTNFDYDSLDRLTIITYADGSSLTNGYDGNGEIVSSTDALGNVTGFEFDSAGRKTRVTDALGNQTAYAHDDSGNVISQTDANLNSTSFTYDSLNRLIRTTYDDGTFTSASYDSRGNKIAETDQAGMTSSFNYDSLGYLITVTDPLGQKISYNYDELGNKIRQQDANGNVTTWQYDTVSRVVRKTYPIGTSETWAYDAVGNVASSTDSNGRITVFVYDNNNRLIRKEFPNLTTEVYTYSPTGKKASTANGSGTTSYTYDVRDRATRIDRPNGISLVYTYDAMDNRTSVTTASGTTTTTLDALNRPITVTDPNGGLTAYSYDPAGNRASLELPNGITTTYTYDNLNRLTSLENSRSNSSLVSAYTYTLAPSGNRLRVSESNGRVVNYSYDDLKRLTQEEIVELVSGSETIDYTYDAHGNRTSKSDSNGLVTYTYDANDRLLSDDSNAYTYDANGNTLSRTYSGGITLYTYDFENQLTGLPSGNVSYEYDSEGVRLSQTVGGVATRYVVDTNRSFAQVLEEKTASGATSVRYVYGDDLISQDRQGVSSYYVYDGQMSTRALTDATETTTDSYVYDAFGVLLDSIGTTENHYLYTGEQFDPNAGFYYLRARYYNPEIGRFTGMDEYPPDIFDPGTLHRYVYVKNNPVNLIDPTGEFFTQISVLVSISIDATLEKAYVKMLAKSFIASLKISKCLIEPGILMRDAGLALITDPYMGHVGARMLQMGSELIAKGLEKLRSTLNEELKNFAESLLPKLTLTINFSIQIGKEVAQALQAYQEVNGYLEKIDKTTKKLLKIEKFVEDIASGNQCGQLEFISETF